MRVRSAVASLVLAVLAAGCVPPDFEKRVAALERQQAALAQQAAAAAAAAERFKNLGADVEAVKAYFKQVADRVRTMRDDMVRLLDEQSMLIEEGRSEYIRILRAQEKVLSDLLPELSKAIAKLDKKLPDADGTIPKAPATPGVRPPPGPPPPPNRDDAPVPPPSTDGDRPVLPPAPPSRDTPPILPPPR